MKPKILGLIMTVGLLAPVATMADTVNVVVSDPTLSGTFNVAAGLPGPLSQFQAVDGTLTMEFTDSLPAESSGSALLSGYVQEGSNDDGGYNYLDSIVEYYTQPASFATVTLASGNSDSGEVGDLYSTSLEFATEIQTNVINYSCGPFGLFSCTDFYYTDYYNQYSYYGDDSYFLDLTLNAADLAEIEATGSLGYSLFGFNDYPSEDRLSVDFAELPTVPEPTTLSLFAFGFAAIGLMGLARKRVSR